jgi:hypothetical protein
MLSRYPTAQGMIISNLSGDVLDTVGGMVARGWRNFLARPSGSFNFRFILQPAIASLTAIRAGLRDGKAGRPAFLWEVVTSSAHRAGLLQEAWKALRTPVLVAASLDAYYQIRIHHWIYPLELIFTVILLAVIPYIILRGPVNRVARFLTRKTGAAGPGDPGRVRDRNGNSRLVN